MNYYEAKWFSWSESEIYAMRDEKEEDVRIQSFCNWTVNVLNPDNICAKKLNLRGIQTFWLSFVISACFTYCIA